MKKRVIVLCLLFAALTMLCSCGDEEKGMSVKEDIIRMDVEDRYTIKVSNAGDSNIEWSSGNENIVVVSTDGTVSAVGKGITTVTAKADSDYVHVGVIVGGDSLYTEGENQIPVFDGESDITEIVVGAVGGGKSDISINYGDKFQLRAYTVPSNSKDAIFWSSDDSSIVKVDEKGMVQAVGKGKTTVTAYAPNGVKGNIIIRVK